MNTHKNARLTVYGRELLVRRIIEHGLRVSEAAQAAGVSTRTAYKWLRRFRHEGRAGLNNRSSRPSHCPHATSPACRLRIVERRKDRQTYRQISQDLGVGLSTVARILRRQGLNRLAHLEPVKPVHRYEYEAPGELLHLDVKKLGRFHRPGHRVTGNRQQDSPGAGWEYVHIAIDDHSRVACGAIYTDETARSACAALLQAVRYYATLGIQCRRLLTDNGSCYKSQRFRRLCHRLGLKHYRTKPYTPRTNGKAERFIRTALHEWAYARTYDCSDQRAQHLPLWLHQYNWHRPHASLHYQPPISRLPAVNNLVGLHS